jgi:hypothetical protein
MAFAAVAAPFALGLMIAVLVNWPAQGYVHGFRAAGMVALILIPFFYAGIDRWLPLAPSSGFLKA